MQPESYKDSFGPLERRWRRLAHGMRWSMKHLTRRQCRILVEIRWRLGDEIMAIPIYEALRERWPQSHIAVLCNHPDLLAGNPHVDAVNAPPAAPDRYVLLRGAERTAYRIEQYARAAGVKTPTSRPRLYYDDWSSPALDALAKNGRPLIAVASGASWPNKRWPVERWRNLCASLFADGCEVVELGRGDESIGQGLCLVNQTTVRDAACVLRAARALVCCDSGLMHLALAVGTPAIALFGPTLPSILVRDEPNLVAVTNNRACHGCFNAPGEKGPEGVCPRNISCCLETITEAAVLNRVRGIVSGGT